MRLIVNPEDEVINGWWGGVFNDLQQALDKLMTRNAATTQLTNAPRAPTLSRFIHHPVMG